MRTLISFLCVFIIFTGVAFAGWEQQQPKTVTLTLTVEEVQIVLKGLDELPHKEASLTYNNIYMQASRQLTPPPQSEKKADSTKPKKNQP